MVSMFVNAQGDRGSIPGRVIPQKNGTKLLLA